MTKEETIEILSTYKNTFAVSQLMLNKIREMETTIYSAQAGFVEQEAGTRISGGKHESRAEKIATLVDLKDKYISQYIKNENVCQNTLKMIQRLYTDNPEIDKAPGIKALKLQKYEYILTAYYINGLTIASIAKQDGYSRRQSVRIMNAARNELYELFKDYSKDRIQSQILQQ